MCFALIKQTLYERAHLVTAASGTAASMAIASGLWLFTSKRLTLRITKDAWESNYL